MMPSYLILIFGMIYLEMMILIKLLWIDTNIWLGIKDVLTHHAFVINSIKAVNLHKR
jgi:hypothetical protein